MYKSMKLSLAVLPLLLLAFSVPVFAGGGGGGSKGGIDVRIKNDGDKSVLVSALSGSASFDNLLAVARTVSAGRVTAFKVNSGAFTAAAAKPKDPGVVKQVKSFNTNGRKTVYLFAQQDSKAATIVGAPAGVKF